MRTKRKENYIGKGGITVVIFSIEKHSSAPVSDASFSTLTLDTALGRSLFVATEWIKVPKGTKTINIPFRVLLLLIIFITNFNGVQYAQK